MSRNTISKTASTWFTISLILLNVTLPQIKADDSESNARLLVSKQILNRYLVEKSDILVRYTIYNVGNIAAQTVTMHDDDFQRQAFDIVGGQPALSIDRIPPQSNYSHVLVVRPKSSGYFNFTAAEVSYKPHEEAEMLLMSISAEPGEGGIVQLIDFNKRFSTHFLDWVAFLVMTLPSLAFPLALWHSSKSKYERNHKNKKN